MRPAIPLALMVACVSACDPDDDGVGGTDVGNPYTTTFSLRVSDGEATLLAADGSLWTLTGAQASVYDLRLSLPPGARCPTAAEVLCEGDTLVVPGLVTVDLLTGASVRPVNLPALRYERVRFTLRGAVGASEQSPGLTLTARGPAGTLEARIPVGVVEAESTHPSLVFDTSAWLDGVDLTACARQPGHFAVQASRCPAAAARLQSNVRDSVRQAD
jgi:hypothetical protein